LDPPKVGGTVRGPVVRRSAAAGAIGALSLAVGGLGVATAVNGGSLTLGHTNTATATTILKDPKGTPLSLVGKNSKPPLAVNSSKQVKHFNASLLGGKSAGDLAVSGSGANFKANTSGLPVSASFSSATLTVRTAPLRPGVYEVDAVAFLTSPNGHDVDCFLGVNNDSSAFDALIRSSSSTLGATTLSETYVASVKKRETIGEFCYSDGSGAVVNQASVAAIRITEFTAGRP
jgi:hypothetical protein